MRKEKLDKYGVQGQRTSWKKKARGRDRKKIAREREAMTSATMREKAKVGGSAHRGERETLPPG